MKRTWILALCALAGVMAGLALPKPVGATAIHAELRVYGGATSYLSCGWHSNCTTGSETSGDALDWDNSDNADVYWELKGWRDDGTTAAIASGTTSKPTASCKTVRVAVKDGFGFDKGVADYLDTDAWTTGGPEYFNGSGSWEPAEWVIGFSVTVANENSGCSIDGSHLHQVNGSTYWTRQGSTGASCDGYYPDYNCQGYTKSGYRDLANWQFKQSFCWYC